MRASMLIARLQHLVKHHGDMDVHLDIGPDGLLSIGEIDTDADESGIVIWSREEEAA